MRIRILLCAGILWASTLPASAEDLSGNWSIVAIGTPVCTFTQAGDFFSGTCDGPAAKGTVVGKVEKETIRWTYYWTAKADGHSGADMFIGRLGPDGSISGTDMNTSGQSARFVAKRQKSI
jgi:hypothetical protein